MTRSNLVYGIDYDTRKAIRKANQLKTAAGEVDDAFEDAETAAEMFSRGVREAADRARDRIDDVRRGSDALADALGDVADKFDTDQIVADAMRAGVEIDDLEANVDDLADALRAADDVQLHAARNGISDVNKVLDDTAAGAGRAGDAVRGLGGGIAGEAVQMTGALGPAGEAVGQIVEGALEGEVAFRQMAGAAVAIGGAVVAFKVIESAMHSIEESKAFREERVEAFTDAIDELGDSVGAVNAVLDETGEITGRVGGILGAFEDTVDITDTLHEVGLTQSDVNEAIADGGAALDDVVKRLEDYRDELLLTAGQGEATVTQVQEHQAIMARFGTAIEVVRQNVDAYGDAVDDTARDHTFMAASQREVNEALDSFIAKKDPIGEFPAEFDRIAAALADGTAPAVDDMNTVVDGLNLTIDEAIGLGYEHADALAEIADEADEAADEISDLTDEYSDFLGELDDRSAYLNVKDSFDDVQRAGTEATEAMSSGAADAERKQRALEQSVLDLRGEVARYLVDVAGIPTDIATDIAAEIDYESIAEAERIFDRLDDPITKWVTINARQGQGPSNGQWTALARGGNTGTGAAMSGERGRPELVDGNLVTGPTPVGAGRRVTGEAETARLLRSIASRPATTTINQYFPVGTTPTAVDDAQRRHTKRNGRNR